MKKIAFKLIMVIVFSCFLFSCGDSESTCSSSIVGTWVGITGGVNNSDILTFKSSGVITYEGSNGCTSSGTFDCPTTATSGNFNVTIDSSSSSATCFPAGSYVCNFVLDGNDLTFSCSNSVYNIDSGLYARQ